MHSQYVRNLLHRLTAPGRDHQAVHRHGLRHTFAAELKQVGTRSPPATWAT
jgi:site-specific recombinase XerD